MSRTPKFWHRLAWSGTIVTLVVLVAWIVSRWFHIGYAFKSGFKMAIFEGSVVLSQIDRDTSSFGYVTDNGLGLTNWPLGSWYYEPTTACVFPLWFLSLLATLSSAFFWHRYRRALSAARIGLCSKCGYDRAGLAPQSPCPECNSTIK